MSFLKEWAGPDLGKTPRQRAIILVVSLGLLLFIWHRNYNLLGDLYDYSGLASANGHLEAGLRPYRDFNCPYQSLPLYLGYAAEMVFGRRYLAQAYANLAFGLAFYFLLLLRLKPGVPFYPRVIAATALCVCTFFQHSMLWYNSVGMMLLCLACLQAVKIFRADRIKAWDVAQLCLWIYLSSMTKINFHALTLGLVVLILAARFWLHPGDFKALLLVVVALILSGCVFGFATELTINHTTFADFIENVIRVPSGRAGDINKLFTFNMFFWTVQHNYPDDLSMGVYGLLLLLYLRCLERYGWFGKIATSTPDSREALFVRYCALAALPVVLISSALLTVSNMETQVLTSSFLLAGFLCVYLLLERALPEAQRRVLLSSIFLFGAYFLVIGSGSAYMHSRLRFGDAPWSGSVALNAYQQRRVSAVLDGLPYYEAKSISPQLEPYFAGVYFTERAKNRLAKVAAFMSRTHPDGDGRDVYWGPGFEMLNRVYGSRYEGRLPLWYHYNVSFREQDVPGIVAELKRQNFQWVVCAANAHHLPQGIQDYLTAEFKQIEQDEILVYQRVHH